MSSLIKFDPRFHNTGATILNYMTRRPETEKIYFQIAEEICACLDGVGDPNKHGNKKRFEIMLNENAVMILG